MILRLVKKGTIVCIADDWGNVYALTTGAISGLLAGKYKILTPTRFSLTWDMDQYPDSPVYDPNNLLEKGLDVKGNTRKGKAIIRRVEDLGDKSVW